MASSEIPVSLYVHVPFCVDKCLYCNFYSVPRGTVSEQIQQEVVAQIVEQARFFGGALGNPRPQTLFMGGGTPSSLPRPLLRQLFSALGSRLSQEWTVEANPESIDEEFLDACEEAGVSRISAGVQSTDDRCLRELHRTGSRQDILKAARLLRKRWSRDLSLDFIAGIPGQKPSEVVSDLSLLDEVRACHVSLYSLTYEPETPLSLLVKRGLVRPNSEERDEELWFVGVEELRRRGYQHYEVSNFCQPGKECRHNLRYWRLDPYVGVGPGAVSTVPAEPIAEALGKPEIAGRGAVLRITNPRDIRAFLSGRPNVWGAHFEVVRPGDFLLETLMMGLRLETGIPADLFRHRFGADIDEILPGVWKGWVERGAAIPKSDRLALSDSGRMTLDNLLEDILRRETATELRVSWP